MRGVLYLLARFLLRPLARVLLYFRDARTPGETLGDFCHRRGKDDLLANCQGTFQSNGEHHD